MLGWLKRKRPKDQDSDQQSADIDEDAVFYQAIVNKFASNLDEYVDNNPDLPEFRDRWHFEITDVNAWHQSETMARMSCKITAYDIQNEFPPLSEWVHGFGDTIDEAFDTGYKNWITTDLPIVVDLGEKNPVLCQQVSFDNKNTKKKTRGLLGPIQLWSLGNDGVEPCCNSCIFTKILENDAGFLSRESHFLVKAVVARNPDNTTQCDLRIEGEQDEELAKALSNWAHSWEGEGFAMRKQSLYFHEKS